MAQFLAGAGVFAFGVLFGASISQTTLKKILGSGEDPNSGPPVIHKIVK